MSYDFECEWRSVGDHGGGDDVGSILEWLRIQDGVSDLETVELIQT